MALSPESVGQEILNLSRWPSFRGYGPIPGIAEATFEKRTETVVGTRFLVKNLDGSSHVEEVTRWDLPRCIEMRMHELSPPLDKLATHFVELWRFEEPWEGRYPVLRSFELHAKGWFGKVILWLVSHLLRRAIARHLREMDSAPKA